MLKIENVEVMGWEHAIRGMRNPMNSWDKSDSRWRDIRFTVGKNDVDLMQRLAKAGTDHRKFMRMITVYLDILAPLYWWKEFDTYKVGTVANSCSTMHKIAAKEFTLDDFSHEHLTDLLALNNATNPVNAMDHIILCLNFYRDLYLEEKNKVYWWQMIQLLPSSYNQRRTIMLNYEVLANIYKSRRNHKLDEWHTLCDWIESLPLAEPLITGPIFREEIEEENKIDKIVNHLKDYDGYCDGRR